MPVPFHPMVVHFPIVLSILLPIFALGSFWAIRRGVTPARAWAVTVLVAGALLISAFVATRSGAAEEDRVEKVVGENALHTHEEAAERFLVLSGLVLLVGVIGLAPAVVGSAARLVATAGSLVLVVAGVQVGNAGGELVYQHNAASAYSSNAVAAAGDEQSNKQAEAPDEDDD